MTRVRVRWIAKVGLDGSVTHRYGSEADLRAFEQRVRGPLATFPRSVIDVPPNLRPFADAVRDVIKAEVRRREAMGGGE